jgi:hypothetical protein
MADSIVVNVYRPWSGLADIAPELDTSIDITAQNIGEEEEEIEILVSSDTPNANDKGMVLRYGNDFFVIPGNVGTVWVRLKYDSNSPPSHFKGTLVLQQTSVIGPAVPDDSGSPSSSGNDSEGSLKEGLKYSFHVKGRDRNSSSAATGLNIFSNYDIIINSIKFISFRNISYLIQISDSPLAGQDWIEDDSYLLSCRTEDKQLKLFNSNKLIAAAINQGRITNNGYNEITGPTLVREGKWGILFNKIGTTSNDEFQIFIDFDILSKNPITTAIWSFNEEELFFNGLPLETTGSKRRF